MCPGLSLCLCRINEVPVEHPPPQSNCTLRAGCVKCYFIVCYIKEAFSFCYAFVRTKNMIGKRNPKIAVALYLGIMVRVQTLKGNSFVMHLFD